MHPMIHGDHKSDIQIIDVFSGATRTLLFHDSRTLEEMEPYRGGKARPQTEEVPRNYNKCQTGNPRLHCRRFELTGTFTQASSLGHHHPTSSHHSTKRRNSSLTITRYQQLHLKVSLHSLRYIKTFHKVVYHWYLVNCPLKSTAVERNPALPVLAWTAQILLNEIRPLLYCYKSLIQNANPLM